MVLINPNSNCDPNCLIYPVWCISFLASWQCLQKWSHKLDGANQSPNVQWVHPLPSQNFRHNSLLSHCKIGTPWATNISDPKRGGKEKVRMKQNKKKTTGKRKRRGKRARIPFSDRLLFHPKWMGPWNGLPSQNQQNDGKAVTKLSDFHTDTATRGESNNGD